MMDNFSARQGLTTEEHLHVNGEFEKVKKSKVVAYLLWFFLGGLGAHRFYTRDTGLGIAIIVVSIISTFLLFIPIGIWLLVDLFLVGKRINQLNDQLEAEVISNVKAART
jgi:TM2 domain-containing membrane protein YozV